MGSSSYPNYAEEKERLIAEFTALLENPEIDINEPVESSSMIPFGCATPLIYFLLVRDNFLADIVIQKFKDKIEPTFKVGEMEYDLLTIVYISRIRNSLTTDALLPLIFHFESLSFLKETRSTSRKIAILEYLLLKSTEDTSASFIDEVKMERNTSSYLKYLSSN